MRSMLRFVFSVIISIFSFYSFSYAPHALCQKNQCVAVIDAGSTGSRLHLYQYELNQNNTPTHIKEIFSKKITPGLATIALKSEAIDDYLVQLLSPLGQEKISVYFYSTAGMRLLSLHKQKQYYKEIKKWFSHRPHFSLKDIKTISGQEEAIFDWLSVNYVLGHLDSDYPDYAAVMDMGGASVQVAFAMTQPLPQNSPDFVTLEINGQTINLFAHSFLGLGQTEVSHQFLNEPACYAKGYPLADGAVGDGEAINCADSVMHLVNDVQHVSSYIQETLKNESVENWYALGGIDYLSQEPYFEVKRRTFTPRQLLEKANQNLCHVLWSQLESISEDEYLYGYCFNAAYYYALIVEGYGLHPETSIHTLAKDQGSDWSLGVVLLNQ